MNMVRGCAVTGLVGIMMALTGCAEGVETDDDVASSLSESAQEGASEAAIQGDTVSLNCGGSLPGLPKPPCLPELTHTQLAVQLVEPGTNIAPGHYIQYGFKNDSSAPAGPFSVKVTDHLGATVKTFAFAGLAAHMSTSIIVHAPYACGWSRTVLLDSSNSVAEATESNNTRTYSKYCPRGL